MSPDPLPKASGARICIVMPYFGQWPEWMELFLESCRWNPGIEWRFFTDCGTPAGLPANVKVEPMTLPEFLQRSEQALGISIGWRSNYKLCDLRPAYGVIFQSALEGYDYYGWGDIDCVFGDLESYVSKHLGHNDCVSFNRKHLSGHLCLFRSEERVRSWYRTIPDWRTRMEAEDYTHFDEIKPHLLKNILSVHAHESYNTPLSPYIRWTDDTFDFPSEWYWENGVLTNDKDGDRQFPHLHFMHWKGGWWPRHCGNAQWEKLDKLVHVAPGDSRFGFRINDRGFFPLPPERTAGERNQC